MATTVTDRSLDRLATGIGALIESHDRGISLADLRSYRGRFVAFAGEVLKIGLTPQQTEAAAALERGDRQVLLLGGNGLGKDLLKDAWALYRAFVGSYLVILSGPVDRTIRESTMRRSVGWLWTRSGLPGELYEMALRIPGRARGGILSFSAVDPERVVSHHAERLLVAITEGQGMSGELFDGFRRLQPTQLVVTANPTTPTAAVHGFSKSAAWTTFEWSCLDHPNVVTGEERFPGAVTRAWVEGVRAEHGESSRFWLTSVLGQFPEESESPLFMAGRWDDAIERGRSSEPPALGDLTCVPRAVVGVDIARGGTDQTALVVRVGGWLWHLSRYREPELLINAERIAHEVEQLVRSGLGVTDVVIDETGDGGGALEKFARLATNLRWTEYRLGGMRPSIVERRVQAVGFKSSRQAPQSQRFVNLRAQSFHHLGVEFEEGRVLVRPGMDADLLADLREELLHHQRIHQADDRILIAPKDEIRRAIGRSPDLADALSMTYIGDLSEAEREGGSYEIAFA